MNRYSPAAAAVILLAALITLFAPHARRSLAADTLLLPDGGQLNALDSRGAILGPCPLNNTDVHVEISGIFTRVTVRQWFENPYDEKIEAVYTFPLSHRAAVDRMTMTIDNRVIEGEVHEREEARAIYEQARRQGHVASLLEQERPNIFTQSVANIEPGVQILIEISYVELLETKDGVCEFTFPTVVGPRYMPGMVENKNQDSGLFGQCDWIKPRNGLVLLAPADLSVFQVGDVSRLGDLEDTRLQRIVESARPIEFPDGNAWHASDDGQSPQVWIQFRAEYPGVSQEFGTLYTNGTGEIAGRWFQFDDKPAAKGAGIASGTPEVPDAARISPPVAPPETRAGHDLSISVDIDTGGPALTDLVCPLHDTTFTETAYRPDGLPRAATIQLADAAVIPNRDFVLSWRPVAEEISEAVFVHTDDRGNFFTLILQPPARVEPTDFVPRELVFVLDTSGSMRGFPMEKARDVVSRAIDAMRPDDTFNLITFAGDTHILWDTPMPATPVNIEQAQEFLETRAGGGGTDMMKAVNAALTQPEVPGGARPLRVVCFLTDGYVGNDQAIIAAIRENAATTRVFSFGIGNSVNRFLLDGMAAAGRGAAEFVLLESDADEAVERFVRRIDAPVLKNIEIEFGDGLAVTDRVPAVVPDLYDERPIILHGRYTTPGVGTLTIRGDAADGPYERLLDLELTDSEPDHDVIATLWARSRVEEIMNRDLAAAQSGNFPPELREQVVELGETFGLMTQYTSFVAVERLRLTIGGEPRLVSVPVELPDGVEWEGIFGKRMVEFAGTLAQAPAAKGEKTALRTYNVNDLLISVPKFKGREIHLGQIGQDQGQSGGFGVGRFAGGAAGARKRGGRGDQADLFGNDRVVGTRIPTLTWRYAGTTDFGLLAGIVELDSLGYDPKPPVTYTVKSPKVHLPVQPFGQPGLVPKPGWNPAQGTPGSRSDAVLVPGGRAPASSMTASRQTITLNRLSPEKASKLIELYNNPSGARGTRINFDASTNAPADSPATADFLTKNHLSYSYQFQNATTMPTKAVNEPRYVIVNNKTADMSEALDTYFEGVEAEQPPAVASTMTRPYDLSDFLADAAAIGAQDGSGDKGASSEPPPVIRRIARSIESTIAPESWKAAGGSGVIRILDSSLEIDQSPEVHRKIDAWLTRLRQQRFGRLSPAPAVLEIIALARAGDLDAAKVRVNALAEAAPDYRPGIALRDLLHDASPISTEEHDKRLEALRTEAARAVAADAERIRTLVRRIDERLLALMWGVPDAETEEPNRGAGGPRKDSGGPRKDSGGPRKDSGGPRKDSRSSMKTRRAAPTIRGGGILVSVLTAAKTPKATAALKAAGLIVENAPESSNLYIGVAPLSRLAEIALLNPVRRIEPVM